MKSFIAVLLKILHFCINVIKKRKQYSCPSLSEDQFLSLPEGKSLISHRDTWHRPQMFSTRDRSVFREMPFHRDFPKTKTAKGPSCTVSPKGSNIHTLKRCLESTIAKSPIEYVSLSLKYWEPGLCGA